METLHITIKDPQTKDILLKLLHTMEGVDVKEGKHAPTPDPSASLQQLCGIWAGRDISLVKIRERAWKRNAR